MITVYKYSLEAARVDKDTGAVIIDLPEAAEVLSAGLDPSGDLCVWAKVSTSPAFVSQPHKFFVAGTGHDMTAVKDAKFLNTVRQGPFMFHVFELNAGD